MSFNDAAEMSSLTRLLRQHKPRPSDTQPVPPRTKRSNSDGKGMNIKFTASFSVSFLIMCSNPFYCHVIPCCLSGDLRTSSSMDTETITSETNQLLASLGINPASATIATTSSIVQVSYIPHYYTSHEHSFTLLHNQLFVKALSLDSFPLSGTSSSPISPSSHNSHLPPHTPSLQLVLHLASHAHPRRLYELRLLRPRLFPLCRAHRFDTISRQT